MRHIIYLCITSNYRQLPAAIGMKFLRSKHSLSCDLQNFFNNTMLCLILVYLGTGSNPVVINRFRGHTGIVIERMVL